MSRFVVRPRLLIISTFGLVSGGTAVLMMALAATTLQHGPLLAAGPFALAGLFFAVMALYIAGGWLVADSDRVRSLQLFEGGSCRREELGRIEVGLPYRRIGPSLRFVRKDGSVAFKGAAAIWKESQVKRLADWLEVPYLGLPKRGATTGHVCPVCGFHGLQEPASTNGMGSGEYCPACGFEHTGRADPGRYRAWRDKWVASGMPWFAAQAGVPQPPDWNPEAQLKQVS